MVVVVKHLQRSLDSLPNRKVIPVANKALTSGKSIGVGCLPCGLEKILRLSLELISTGAAIYFSP